MKKTRIIYNPYENAIEIASAPSLDAEWQSLPDSSPLRRYTIGPALFSNCVTDIVEKIDKGQNSSADGLEIDFCGTDADFRILKAVTDEVNARRKGTGPLTYRKVGSCASADDAIAVIRGCYTRISSEFEGFMPGGLKYDEHRELGDGIVKFEETISDEVPICIVGNYSVGKSALINAIIGDEVMPSRVDPSTARNVKIIHDADRHSMTLERSANGIYELIALNVADGSVGVSTQAEESSWTLKLLAYLEDRIGFSGKSANRIIHDILDLLNGDEVAETADLGMNVLVRLPFADSVVTSMGRGIAFYDTPGSNNSNVDQNAHKTALREFMSEQTNALPIVATTKDAIMSDDNLRLRKMLDEYSDNFSSLNSLVVIAKCDTLSDTELRGKIHGHITTWHGKTPVLYTTAIGALGERKGKEADWIDPGLAKQYRSWIRDYSEDPETRTLPRYNEEPCGGREDFDIRSTCSDALFATGLPSLECEIMRYAREYADYKKCERGRSDLLKALDQVKEEVERQRQRVSDEKKQSERVRKRRRRELVDKLRQLNVEPLGGMIDALYGKFESAIGVYVAEVKGIIGGAYDDAVIQHADDLDGFVNGALRDHCQENLINACFLGAHGIQNRIVNGLEARAAAYASQLHEFIEGNDSHFTEDGKKALSEHIERGAVVPTIEKVESELPPLAGLLQIVSIAQYQYFKFRGNEERARAVWIESKRGQLDEMLRDGATLLGGTRRGLFSKTAIIDPIASYDEQLKHWAGVYRNLILECIDDENAYLSGMEGVIAEHERELADLTDRLERLAEAEAELETVLSMSTDGDGRKEV